MEKPNNHQRENSSDWLVESLRCTAFPIPGYSVLQDSWWTDLIGEPPESRTTRPRTGRQIEEGLIDGSKLELRIQPSRIDWILTKPVDEDGEPEGFAFVETIPKSLSIFEPLISKWLEWKTVPKITRLALGAILLKGVDDRKKGYETLFKYLPTVQQKPEEVSDFMFQINRPRASSLEIEGLKINRLCKWSVSQLMILGMSAQSGDLKPVERREQFACRLELDISTSQHFEGELPHDKLSTIFNELIAFGTEIAEKGDIP